MKSLDYKKIGEKLKKLRTYMGLTQQEVAEILNIGRDAIIRIEHGDRKIDVAELMNFSKLYSISMEELLTNEKNNNIYDEAYARGFNNLSVKDKEEIMNLIEYKNRLKAKEEHNNVRNNTGKIS